MEQELAKLLDPEHFEVGDKVVRTSYIADYEIKEGTVGFVRRIDPEKVSVDWDSELRDYGYHNPKKSLKLHDDTMHQRITMVLQNMTGDQYNRFVKNFIIENNEGSLSLQRIAKIRTGEFWTGSDQRHPGNLELEVNALRSFGNNESFKITSGEEGSDEMTEEKKSHAIVVDISWTKTHDKTLHRRIKRVTGIVPLIDGEEVGPVETAIACLPLANLGKHDPSVTEEFQVKLKGKHPNCEEETQMKGVAQLHNSMLRSIRAKAEQQEADWKKVKKELIRATKEAKFPENGETGGYGLNGERPFIGDRIMAYEDITVDEKEHKICYKKHNPRKEARLAGGVVAIFGETEPELLKLCADKCEEFTIAHREFVIKVLERQLANKKEVEKNEALRVKTIKSWARQHGSRRLKEQLKQGYEPQDLYLEERMQLELAPDAKVFHCADAKTDIIEDPDENQLSATRKVAERAVKTGLFENLNDVFDAMTVRKMTGCGEEKTVIIIEGVKPGKGFEEYQSVIILDSKVVVSSADKYDALYDEPE